MMMISKMPVIFLKYDKKSIITLFIRRHFKINSDNARKLNLRNKKPLKNQILI